MSYLIDTDILINSSHGIKKDIEFIKQTGHPLISIITASELLQGARNKNELTTLTAFIKKFIVLHINEGISQKAYNLIEKHTLSHHLLLNDALPTCPI